MFSNFSALLLHHLTLCVSHPIAYLFYSIYAGRRFYMRCFCQTFTQQTQRILARKQEDRKRKTSQKGV